MKNDWFPEKKFSEKGRSIYIFANLFDVCLNWSQLDFHISFCTQSVVMFFQLKYMKKI